MHSNGVRDMLGPRWSLVPCALKAENSTADQREWMN